MNGAVHPALVRGGCTGVMSGWSTSCAKGDMKQLWVCGSGGVYLGGRQGLAGSPCVGIWTPAQASGCVGWGARLLAPASTQQVTSFLLLLPLVACLGVSCRRPGFFLNAFSNDAYLQGLADCVDQVSGKAPGGGMDRGMVVREAAVVNVGVEPLVLVQMEQGWQLTSNKDQSMHTARSC